MMCITDSQIVQGKSKCVYVLVFMWERERERERRADSLIGVKEYTVFFVLFLS